jgi:hypothetical protein
MQMAARIGYTFGMDPVAVLRDEGDDFLMMIRIAALDIWASDEQKRQEKS